MTDPNGTAFGFGVVARGGTAKEGLGTSVAKAAPPPPVVVDPNAPFSAYVFKTVIDKKESGRYLGRTEFDSVEVDNEVVVHSEKKLQAGDFVNVKISKAYDYDLEGDVV